MVLRTEVLNFSVVDFIHFSLYGKLHVFCVLLRKMISYPNVIELFSIVF